MSSAPICSITLWRSSSTQSHFPSAFPGPAPTPSSLFPLRDFHLPSLCSHRPRSAPWTSRPLAPAAATTLVVFFSGRRPVAASLLAPSAGHITADRRAPPLPPSPSPHDRLRSTLPVIAHRFSSRRHPRSRSFDPCPRVVRVICGPRAAIRRRLLFIRFRDAPRHPGSQPWPGALRQPRSDPTGLDALSLAPGRWT